MPAAPQLQDLTDLLPKSGVESASRLGLSLAPDLAADAWSKMVAKVAQAAGRVSGGRVILTAWLGDLLAYGDGKYKGQIKEYAQAAGLEPGTLRIAKLVCSRIPVFSRLNTLSWAHHCEIGTAFKEPREISRWLEIAARGGHSKSELRRLIREHLATQAATSLPSSATDETGSFGILRDLRAANRLLRDSPQPWVPWSPAVCVRTLNNLAAVADFINQLKARAAQAPAPRP